MNHLELLTSGIIILGEICLALVIILTLLLTRSFLHKLKLRKFLKLFAQEPAQLGPALHEKLITLLTEKQGLDKEVAHAFAQQLVEQYQSIYQKTAQLLRKKNATAKQQFITSLEGLICFGCEQFPPKTPSKVSHTLAQSGQSIAEEMPLSMGFSSDSDIPANGDNILNTAAIYWETENIAPGSKDAQESAGPPVFNEFQKAVKSPSTVNEKTTPVSS